jgi:hypothetical protein
MWMDEYNCTVDNIEGDVVICERARCADVEENTPRSFSTMLGKGDLCANTLCEHKDRVEGDSKGINSVADAGGVMN